MPRSQHGVLVPNRHGVSDIRRVMGMCSAFSPAFKPSDRDGRAGIAMTTSTDNAGTMGATG